MKHRSVVASVLVAALTVAGAIVHAQKPPPTGGGNGAASLPTVNSQ